MANMRLSMRKIKDVLRLTHDVHLNTRQVALSLNIRRSTVTNYQERAQKAELSWPLPEDLTEEALEQKLFPPLVSVQAPAKALPDFDYIYRELKAYKKSILRSINSGASIGNSIPTATNTRSSVSSIALTAPSSIVPCARTTRAARNCLSITAKGYR
jgi:hypothetical protein